MLFPLPNTNNNFLKIRATTWPTVWKISMTGYLYFTLLLCSILLHQPTVPISRYNFTRKLMFARTFSVNGWACGMKKRFQYASGTRRSGTMASIEKYIDSNRRTLWSFRSKFLPLELSCIYGNSYTEILWIDNECSYSDRWFKLFDI